MATNKQRSDQAIIDASNSIIMCVKSVDATPSTTDLDGGIFDGLPKIVDDMISGIVDDNYEMVKKIYDDMLCKTIKTITDSAHAKQDEMIRSLKKKLDIFYSHINQYEIKLMTIDVPLICELLTICLEYKAVKSFGLLWKKLIENHWDDDVYYQLDSVTKLIIKLCETEVMDNILYAILNDDGFKTKMFNLEFEPTYVHKVGMKKLLKVLEHRAKTDESIKKYIDEMQRKKKMMIRYTGPYYINNYNMWMV